MPFILGTAGHIDHGKTTLVRALTGIDCDRLGEEKKRGITIELGFAWLDLPDGQRLGIVDVPGHERFVKNMVAGATGIDFVMLVIAADEGVMPQTREHLEICSLLGIRQGIVVLTKTDLVDADWLELVKEDVTAFLKGTFLKGAPLVCVSSSQGTGLDDLRALLAAKVKELSRPRGTDIFRLPVDRIFSLKGHGTIVTGTVISGRLPTDSDAEIYPAARPTHVRSLQRHETNLAMAEAGERCAANLQGLDTADVARGSVLSTPGALFPSDRWIVRLACLPSSPMPLKHRTEVHFHHGTTEVQARLHLFGTDRIDPGEEATAEIRFPLPMTGVFGDRCVIRSSAPLRCVAGGMLVSPLPPAMRKKDPAYERRLELLAALPALAEESRTAAGQAAQSADTNLVSAVLELRGQQGAPFALLRVLTGLPKKHAEAALQKLSAAHAALCFDKETQAWIGADALDQLRKRCLARTADLHAKEPLKPGFPRQALEAGWAEGLPAKLVQKIFDLLLKEGKLSSDGETLRLTEHSVVMSGGEEKLSASILDACRKGGITPPRYVEVLQELKVTEKQAAPVLKLLLTRRELIRVTPELYYSREAMQEIISRVSTWFASHDDLSVPGMKELLGISRKYIIALLEYLDREKITVRIGDKRQFRTSQVSS